MQLRLNAPYLVHDAHAANAELFNDAVVGDGLDDYWRESYFGRTGKSTNAGRAGCARNVLRYEVCHPTLRATTALSRKTIA